MSPSPCPQAQARLRAIELIEGVLAGSLDAEQAIDAWPTSSGGSDGPLDQAMHAMYHYLSDGDIRAGDETYAKYQRGQLRQRADELRGPMPEAKAQHQTLHPDTVMGVLRGIILGFALAAALLYTVVLGSLIVDVMDSGCLVHKGGGHAAMLIHPLHADALGLVTVVVVGALLWITQRAKGGVYVAASLVLGWVLLQASAFVFLTLTHCIGLRAVGG